MRALVKKHLPRGYQERMQYGMIGWVVPKKVLPMTYNGQALAIAGLAAQKHQISLYLVGRYAVPAVGKAFDAAAKQMKGVSTGKSCVRFKQAAQLDPAAVAAVLRAVPVDVFVASHQAAHAGKRLRPVVD